MLTCCRAAVTGRVEPQMPLENFEDLPVDVLEHVHRALASAKLSAKNVLPVLEVPCDLAAWHVSADVGARH